MKMLVIVGWKVLGIGFYSEMSSSHGTGVKMAQGILPCFVMEAKGLARLL